LSRFVTTFCDAGGSVRISISSMDKKAIITIMGVRCSIDDETRSLLLKLLSVEIPILEMESKEGRVETHNVLTLCNRIIRNHGGDLLLGREAKNKLIFRVKLPVLSRLPEAGEVEKIAFEQVYDLVGTLDMDVLVVDDEEYVRNTLYYFFARKGCRVTLAEDGEFGLKVAKEKHFDIIFMDYLMPKMGGIEAARKIREADREVKIVVITGREPFDEDELHRTGIYACIKKPFEIKELYTIAKKAAIESGIIE
jgi:CheY-like chemotaxis protein